MFCNDYEFHVHSVFFEQAEPYWSGGFTGLIFLRILIISGIDDFEFEVKVGLNVEEVVVVIRILFCKCDVVGGHDYMNLFISVVVDPEGAVQTELIFFDLTDDIGVDWLK